MAQCSDCYNGCVEIVSDKCVKYTGVDVPLLDIKKGDSLSWVEQALITFLTSTIDGSGIQITLEDEDYCEVVSQYLGECETITALELFRALVKAVCSLQTQIGSINETINILNAEYTIGCLEDVEGDAGTHDIVQAIINKLCLVDEELTALALDLETNYVKISDLNSLIAEYLESQEVTNKAYTKMIPYVAMEYYGQISNYPETGDSFDGTGAGLGYWENVYLCNGDNGTPDKRGRVAVGATSTPGVIAMDSAVDPAVPGNPAYTVNDTAHGTNTITLDETQIPAHDHEATTEIEPNPHKHTIGLTENDAANLIATGGQTAAATQDTSEVELTATTVISETGGGLPHDNYQPGIGAYYIMYIPA